MSVTYARLAERLSSALSDTEVELTPEQAHSVLHTVMDLIIDALANGEDVALDGFGRFYPDMKPPKRVHSGITRKNYNIGYRIIVKFNAFNRLNSKVRKLLQWMDHQEMENDDGTTSEPSAT